MSHLAAQIVGTVVLGYLFSHLLFLLQDAVQDALNHNNTNHNPPQEETHEASQRERRGVANQA